MPRRGMNNNLALPFEALLQDVKATRFPDATELTMKNGLRVFKPEAALLLVPARFIATILWRRQPF